MIIQTETIKSVRDQCIQLIKMKSNLCHCLIAQRRVRDTNGCAKGDYFIKLHMYTM